ncbi:MAG: tape measure protein, partial [Emcibacter sp.]|nr:tape measure protein [Emcibacter sp.]
MSDDLHALLIRLDADTRRMQANVTRATRHVDGKLGHIEKRLKRSDQRFEKWGKNIARNVRVGLAAAVVLAGRQALLTADKIDVLQDRIKDATRESGGFNKVWDGITATAIKTGSVLGNNVELFQRLSIAAGDLGATNTDILRLNETVQKLGIISGASTSSLAAGTTQLAQGLGAGIFRAEEFNSILENIPAVANAIAKSLGKSTSELRKMVLAGKLASKDVFQALIESSAEVDKRFSEIPPRLERAWSGLLTAMATRIDKVNDALKITVALASSLEGLTQLITQDDVSEIEMLAQEIGNLEREIEKLNKTRMHFGYLDIAKEKTEELLKLHSKMMNMIAISGKPNIPTIFPNDTTRQGFSIDQKSKPKDRFVHGDTPAPKAKPGDPVVRQGINDAEAKIISLIAASEAEEKQVGMTAAAITRMNAEMEIYADLAARGIIATD